MGNQRKAGLTKRGGIWHIDKQFRGARICESTGTSDIRQAEEYLAKRIIELRETRLYGARELRTFRSAATKYLLEYNYKKRIKDDAGHLKQLDPFIGAFELKQVHMGSLQDFIAQRRRDGVKTKTLNGRRPFNGTFEPKTGPMGHLGVFLRAGAGEGRKEKAPKSGPGRGARN